MPIQKMKTRSVRVWKTSLAGSIFLFLCFALYPWNTAKAASGNPAPLENYVNDFAEVLPSMDAQTLRDQLQSLEKQTGIEGTVVTVPFMAEYRRLFRFVWGFFIGGNARITTQPFEIRFGCE